MPHLYSDQQKQVRDETRRVLTDKCSPARLRALLELKGTYDAEAWAQACNMGWTAVAVAEDAGGLGLGLIEQLIIAEECGRALFSAPYLATGAAAAHLLSAAGNPSGILSRLAAGEMRPALAFAEQTEPLPDRPAARFRDGRLFGTKTAVLGGAGANLALVLASDQSGAPALAMANLDDAEVSRQVLDTIDNSRCLAHLAFQGVPATRLDLAAPLEAARQALGRLALFSASEAVGGTDSCIALSVAYANERQAFGQAIGKFQAVKHGITEMYVLNELARASVLDAAVHCEDGAPDAETYVAAARLNAMHAYGSASAGATQIHGALGATWEADLHLHYRRARALAVEAASPAFWEDLIVKELAE